MFVVVFHHSMYRGEVLPDKLTQNAGACSVKYADARSAYHQGIVNKISHCLQSFVATHAAYVNFRFEIKFSFPYIISNGFS